MEAKGNSATLSVGVYMGTGTIKTSKKVLLQQNIQKPNGPTIPCLGSDPEKIRIHSDLYIHDFRAA